MQHWRDTRHFRACDTITPPNSKEQNRIVEKVNNKKRTATFETSCQIINEKTEKRLNSSLKQWYTVGASPNTLLFEIAMPHEPSSSKNTTPVSIIRACVDEFMQRHEWMPRGINCRHKRRRMKNLRKRYANYKRLPELQIRKIHEDIEDEHEKPRDSSTSIAQMFRNAS